ncbi:hypothetical protein BDV98DRAFT_579063 [Pterulicium gracile]|uniref:Uncharacterized protein n=1 Tax=Pterulicium gracile TaxID=1884261 RepID=A0A5C3R8H8_9AGAR|nr:hypothetical protein BDV98DRAFT_579063 [Pterula gracilis]
MPAIHADKQGSVVAKDWRTAIPRDDLTCAPSKPPAFEHVRGFYPLRHHNQRLSKLRKASFRDSPIRVRLFIADATRSAERGPGQSDSSTTGDDLDMYHPGSVKLGFIAIIAWRGWDSEKGETLRPLFPLCRVWFAFWVVGQSANLSRRTWIHATRAGKAEHLLRDPGDANTAIQTPHPIASSQLNERSRGQLPKPFNTNHSSQTSEEATLSGSDPASW